LGAVIGLGVFWVVELKRDPHAPFKYMQQVLIVQNNFETRHWEMSVEHFSLKRVRYGKG
jgi:hypothetical protein